MTKKIGVTFLYKLLIVDDEEIIRLGLKKFVNWKELGFEVVGDFESANSVLEFMESERVDIILTDIKMPDMDGLSLIEALNKADADVKTIILSGHEEFEYAKKALRLGAYDFLTKPVDFSELKKTFIEVRKLLDENMSQKKKNSEYINLQQDRILNNLAKGAYIQHDNYDRKLSELGIINKDIEFRCIRLYMAANGSQDNLIEKDIDLLKKHLGELIKALFEDITCYIFNNSINEIGIILYSQMPDDDLKNLLEEVNFHITDKIKVLTHFGVSKKYVGGLNIALAYNEAGKALEYRIFKKVSSILFYSDIIKFFNGPNVIKEDVKNNILNMMSQADEHALKEYLNQVINSIYENKNISVNMLYDSFAEILLSINKYLSSIDDSFLNSSSQVTLKELLEKDTLEDIKKYIDDYINKSINFIREIRESNSGRIVENAKKYINMHYSEEISLSILSEILYVHPIYLSKQFKEKTGENFIDYLTKVRVEKSKELLSDFSLKIYEISEMVGYESSKYFSKIFRELVGQTPKEYRDSIVL